MEITFLGPVMTEFLAGGVVFLVILVALIFPKSKCGHSQERLLQISIQQFIISQLVRNEAKSVEDILQGVKVDKTTPIDIREMNEVALILHVIEALDSLAELRQVKEVMVTSKGVLGPFGVRKTKTIRYCLP